MYVRERSGWMQFTLDVQIPCTGLVQMLPSPPPPPLRTNTCMHWCTSTSTHRNTHKHAHRHVDTNSCTSTHARARTHTHTRPHGCPVPHPGTEAGWLPHQQTAPPPPWLPALPAGRRSATWRRSARAARREGRRQRQAATPQSISRPAAGPAGRRGGVGREGEGRRGGEGRGLMPKNDRISERVKGCECCSQKVGQESEGGVMLFLAGTTYNVILFGISLLFRSEMRATRNGSPLQA